MAMRGLIVIAIAISAVWVIDRLALQSRIGNSVVREAQYQGQIFNSEVTRWLRKLR